MPATNMPLKFHINAICPNYLMCINRWSMSIYIYHSLASIMWPGGLCTWQCWQWYWTMMTIIPTTMIMTPQPNCRDWAGHLAKAAKKKEDYIRQALQDCKYPNWALTEPSSKAKNHTCPQTVPITLQTAHHKTPRRIFT